ncbi:MAG: hypothetical protein JSU07_05315 [Bacteroidetes bacterium]|nr:hypothetical protein [Bacteroidota bacterium]
MIATLFNPQNNAGYMRAGKTIDFLPGTYITTGNTNGSVHAYIQPYNCATNNSLSRMKNSAKDTTLTDFQPHKVQNLKIELNKQSTSKNGEPTYITELPLSTEQSAQDLADRLPLLALYLDSYKIAVSNTKNLTVS